MCSYFHLKFQFHDVKQPLSFVILSLQNSQRGLYSIVIAICAVKSPVYLAVYLLAFHIH